ncbi:hypothetical protein G6F57_015056 [Rhizopus arrhizus]|nr:hypothetical protein G6F57_015056 [Rhizopus arrhizus]
MRERGRSVLAGAGQNQANPHPILLESVSCARIGGQQGLDQAGVADLLGLPAQAAGGEDGAQLVDGGVEHLVDDHVVELVEVQHLVTRRAQALGDDRLAVLAALAHAVLQRLLGRRQDEHGDRARHQLAHLLRALPVDFQQHVLAGGQLRFHRLPGGALPVAVHPGMLAEISGGDHLLELFGTDEVVVLAVHFTRAHRTRSEGNRQAVLVGSGHVPRTLQQRGGHLGQGWRQGRQGDDGTTGHRAGCEPSRRRSAPGIVQLDLHDG